jgi:putative hydrolase
MRQHFLGLVEQSMSFVDPDPKRFLEALRRVVEGVREGRSPLEDGGLPALFATPEQAAVLQQVGGLMSLLEGHGDVTMDRAGAGLIPASERFSRVLRQRRQTAKPLAKVVQRLIGLEAKMNQYEQGERFISAVEEVGGPELLNRAFLAPDLLPTLAEIRAPHDWIARVQVSTSTVA